MIELRVTSAQAGVRLDRYLAGEVADLSRARLQTLIRTGFVRLNGAIPRPRELVRRDDLVQITLPPLEKIENEAEDISLNVLFEDDDLLVINKPSGMVVHPGAGNREHTLVNALLAHCTNLSGIGGKERPGIVHRLDKETSGCVVVAKNDFTHQDLAKQFASREVEKIYLAVVTGTFKKNAGVIDAAIGRHRAHRQKMAVMPARGRAAKTSYRVIHSGGGKSVVECALHSGRTHQIRVHLHHIGHPVLGDKVYAPRLANEFSRQMLHAWKLGFRHPRTNEFQKFEAPLPDDFKAAMQEVKDS